MVEETGLDVAQEVAKVEKPKTPTEPPKEKAPLGVSEQKIVDRIDKDGDEDKVLADIVEGISGDKKNATDQKGSSFFNIQETPEGFNVTVPGGVSDIGAIAAYSRVVGSREEAEQILTAAQENLHPRVELASLQKSFSSFHSIRAEDGGKYSVTFPAFRSIDNPGLLVGTSKKAFDSWEEAKNFYLETRNRRELPEEAVFELKVDGTDLRFSHLDKFGNKPRLSDKPLEIPVQTKAVLDFDSRNAPDHKSASTYNKTLEIPAWQSQVYRFVETFTQTLEGQQLVDKLGIKDLRLLTPQQAAKLTLELVTRLKKYNLDEMEAENTQSDQNSALFLLQRGLRNRDNADYKGNGVCRNFASTVKVVFEGLKANQTKFNYLQDTYAFFEGGPRADFDPTYEAPKPSSIISLKKDASPGHAWNSFVTVEPTGVSQTVVDATFSNFDYDTQESVKLDYTLERMEKDINRNLKRKGTQIDTDQAAQFYLFMIDSLPQQQGLVLDPEAIARARASQLYQNELQYIKSKYADLSPEQYDKYALSVYKNTMDKKNADKAQFYIDRAMEAVRGRENGVSETTATELTRLVAGTKQDVGYFDVIATYSLSTQRTEDRLTAVGKYARAWEAASAKGYIPIRDLVFANREIQQAVLMACSTKTKEELVEELKK